MLKIREKISKWFDNASRKLGNALQNEKTAQNSPDDEKHEQKEENNEPPRQKETTQQQTKQNADDAGEKSEQPQNTSQKMDAKDELPRKISQTLKKVVEYRNATDGKTLVVWLDCGQLPFNNYNTEEYRQQVLSYLVNENGFGFKRVSFSLGKPAPELHATRIGDNDLEYLQVIEEEKVPEQVSCKAVISVFGEAGSLLEDKYIISVEDMKEKMITFYNIGAGKFPKIPTGYRENHIAIDDNPGSPMVEKNKFVSRMHAHIGFSDKLGFFFQVEKDGTRLVGKRTRIFRGEEKIECENPEAKIPLQDGDLIELGKAVVLKYKQLNEE